MGLVLALCLGLYGLGAIMGSPARMRWTMIGLVLAAVVVIQLVLPDGHTLRRATGGSAAPWLMILGVAALVWCYRAGLGSLRRMAEQKDAQMPDKTETYAPGELDRYLRHIVLRELGGQGQKALKEARVLVIGAGGLGSPALLYLAAAGVGRIGVIDDDAVDASNLQRQVIHRDPDIATPKVFSAQRAMQEINPYLDVRPYHRRLTPDIARDLIAEYDIVLDGTDNFDTRYLANEICVALGKPLISGALSQWEGQISLFEPAKTGPCYRCIFPQAPAEGLAPSCAEAGVLGPLPGVVGSMMAVEAVKWITGAGAVLRGEMLIYDALWGETRKITMKARPDCPTCGSQDG